MFEKSWSDTCILLSLCFVTANVFPLCQAVSKCILPLVKQFLNVSISVFCLFSNLNRFQMYLELFPIVSANVFCLLSISSLTIVPASTPDCLLQPLSDSKQQFLYLLIAHRLYFLSALFCNITRYSGQSDFSAKTRGCAQGRWGKKMEIGILRTANDV